MVDGIDTAHTQLSPYASGTISSGRGLRASDAKSRVAVVDSGYATTQKLRVGSTVTVAGKSFKVIGIISQAPGGSADVYIPLAADQAIGLGPFGWPAASSRDRSEAGARPGFIPRLALSRVE
jgi:putative ABC transport system permease protein